MTVDELIHTCVGELPLVDGKYEVKVAGNLSNIRALYYYDLEIHDFARIFVYSDRLELCYFGLSKQVVVFDLYRDDPGELVKVMGDLLGKWVSERRVTGNVVA